MANALTIFKNRPPSRHDDFFKEESNTVSKSGVPSLLYEGKVWTISLLGQKTKLEKPNDDGDMVPMPIMRAVILNYNANRGRALYMGNYDPTKPGVPVCWSDDGVTAAPSVTDPKWNDKPLKDWNKKCSQCYYATKGSKVAEGRSMTACSQHRMLALVPGNDLEFEPLRMKIAITSDWDSKIPDQEAKGWFSFKRFTDMLKANGVHHTAQIVTKIKFDPGAAYPKLLFAIDRWTDDDERDILKPLVRSEKVAALLSGSFTPAGADGKPAAEVDEEEDEAPVRVQKAKSPPPAADVAEDDDEDTTPAPVAKKAAKPVAVEDDEDEPAPKKVAKAKPTVVEDEDEEEAPAPKKAKAKPVVVEDEDEEPAPPKKAAKAKAKPEAPKVNTDTPEDVEDMLADWED